MISLAARTQKEKEGFCYHVTPIRYNDRPVVLSFHTEAFRLQNRIGQVFMKLQLRDDSIYDILHSIETTVLERFPSCRPLLVDRMLTVNTKCDISSHEDWSSEDYIVDVKIGGVFEGSKPARIKRSLKSIRKA